MKLAFHPIRYVKDKLRNVQTERQQRKQFNEFKKMLVSKDADLNKAAFVYDANADSEIFFRLLSDGEHRVQIRTLELLKINLESGKDISEYMGKLLDIVFQDHFGDVLWLARNLSRSILLNNPSTLYDLFLAAGVSLSHRSDPATGLLTWVLQQEKLRADALDIISCDLRFSPFGEQIYLHALEIVEKATASKDQELAREATVMVRNILNSDSFQLEMARNTPHYVTVIGLLAKIMRNAGIAIDGLAMAAAGAQ